MNVEEKSIKSNYFGNDEAVFHFELRFYVLFCGVKIGILSDCKRKLNFKLVMRKKYFKINFELIEVKIKK
jgi:hypothetical protein